MKVNAKMFAQAEQVRVETFLAENGVYRTEENVALCSIRRQLAGCLAVSLKKFSQIAAGQTDIPEEDMRLIAALLRCKKEVLYAKN